MAIKVASFNVENLFSRARALNIADNRRTRDVLEKVALLQHELEKPVYDNEPLMLSLLGELKWYIQISDEKVRLYRSRNRKPHQILPRGAQEWQGTLRLKRARFSDMSRQHTAKVIKTINADLCCIVEAEDLVTLRAFDSQLMRSKYKYDMLIDGNDARGIDVGLYSKFPLGSIHTHMFDRKGRSRIFSRDCLRVEALVNGTPVHLLINHLKSKGFGSARKSDQRRKDQADRIRAIIEENYDLSNDYVIVAGDLNDTPDSAPLNNMLSMPNLYDVLEAQFGDDVMQRWTYYFAGRYMQIDYLLVSRPLKDRLIRAGVERRGMADLQRLSHGSQRSFDGITSSANAGSDHGAVWATFNM